MYEVKLNGYFTDEYPNMIVKPCHLHITKTDRYNCSICLSQSVDREILSFLDKIDIDICEITTETPTEPLMLEVILCPSEKLSQSDDGKFICSPADISVH